MSCLNCESCALENKSDPDLYEIHVTVETEDFEKFEEDCKKIGVKAIKLENFSKSGSLFDVMTSSTFKTGLLMEAHIYMLEIAYYLESKGYNVLRHKLETTLKNIYIPACKDGYGESHTTVICDGNRDIIDDISSRTEAFVSTNTNKPNKVLITIREHSNDLELLKSKTDEMIILLNKSAIFAEKTIYEYCIYDSNLAHDDAWITK